MNEIITGYQYGSIHGEYRGIYNFPNNLDKEDIHLPPLTTLIPPPQTSEGMIACWNGIEWLIEEDDNKSVIKVKPIPEEELGRLTPEFVQHQIEIGLWSNELQAKYEIAKQQFLQEEQVKLDAIRQKAIQDAMAIKQTILANRAAAANT